MSILQPNVFDLLFITIKRARFELSLLNLKQSSPGQANLAKAARSRLIALEQATHRI